MNDTSSAQSGSTVLGVLGAILAIFFLYAAAQRLIWSLGGGLVREYLLLAIVYLIIGVLSVGIAVYGLSSKQTGAQLLSAGSILVGAILWAVAAYYWVRGFFFGGTETDIFVALSFGAGGLVLFVIGGVLAKTFEKRGLIESDRSAGSGV